MTTGHLQGFTPSAYAPDAHSPTNSARSDTGLERCLNPIAIVGLDEYRRRHLLQATSDAAQG